MDYQKPVAFVFGVAFLHFMLWLGAFEFPVERGAKAVFLFIFYLLSGFQAMFLNDLRRGR